MPAASSTVAVAFSGEASVSVLRAPPVAGSVSASDTTGAVAGGLVAVTWNGAETGDAPASPAAVAVIVPVPMAVALLAISCTANLPVASVTPAPLAGDSTATTLPPVKPSAYCTSVLAIGLPLPSVSVAVASSGVFRFSVLRAAPLCGSVRASAIAGLIGGDVVA